jgi:hypothetical protein
VKSTYIFILLLSVFFLIYCNEETNIPSLENGLLGFYPFDGNTYNSVSQNEADIDSLSLFNGSYGTDRNNEEMKCLVSSYLGAPPVSFKDEQFHFDDQFSIAIWYYTDEDDSGSGSNWQTLVSKWDIDAWDSEAEGYYLGFHSSGTLRWRYNDHILESTFNFSKNQWTHIVATFSDNKMELYVNGALDTHKDISFDGRTDFDAPFTVGAVYQINSSWIVRPFIGMLDELRLYNKVLNEEEVLDLYNL